MFVFYNPNPKGGRVGDCAVRAICKATRRGWEDVFLDMAAVALSMADMPSSNAVWGLLLRQSGFKKYIPDGVQTVNEFEQTHDGVYVLALSGHAVAVVNGNHYDTWDCGEEHILYFWKMED